MFATCAGTTSATHGRRSPARSSWRSRPPREYERVGLELSLGTQASDRMVGEPTTFTKAWFDAFPNAADATPLLAAARSVKTEQEVARIRIANAIAADAMEHVRARLDVGMRESEAAAIWQGFVHGQGTARDDVELALPFSLVWAGRGIKTFTATGDRPVTEDEPVLFEIWVCADGYWADHTKNVVVGELRDDYRELEEGLLGVYGRAVAHCVPGASFAELDVAVREGLAALGYPGSRRTRSATASARARTSLRTRTRQAAVRSPREWSWRSSRGATGKAAVGCGSRTTS